MTTHELKIWPEFFQAIERGQKTFDVRFNDRGFASGDVLDLREWEPHPALGQEGTSGIAPGYTGRSVKMLVTYVLHGGTHPGLIEPLCGIVKGFCVLGLKPIEETTK
jgi:hypothetical protein